MTRPSLEDVLARPAMNGGWDKLARQQDEQCRELKVLRRRTRRVEAGLKRWDRRWAWLAGALGTTTVAVVAKIVVEIFTRVLH